MSEKHMPTMATVEAAWDAMGDGRFVAWLASHEAKIKEQTLAPFVKMVDDMREAVASDVLIFGEGEYPVSFFADKLEECIDKTDAVLTLADERAKRPDRQQVRVVVDAEFWQEHPDAERLTSALLALKTETDQELQDRIEVLEKNLAYEVAQKIKLAEQLQAATATDLTLEQARWKMHAGIESRCSEEVAAEVKPVIDLVFSSLALEPEAREEPSGTGRSS